MTRKLVLIHLFFIVISFGIKYYHLTGPDLIWNMFLALGAFDFATIAQLIKKPLLKLGAGVLWLFFYPNTFYMLTDIVHMHFATSFLTDQTSMVLYMLYVSSILFGVLCGIASVDIIFATFKVNYGTLGIY